MTKNEAKKFINAFIHLRSNATDAQALGATAAYPSWSSGVSYQVGDRVAYNNVLYRVITAHTSQDDWTPDAAVSLFAEVLIVDEDTVAIWVQPDSTNPYMKGDKVLHLDKTWVSDIDYNVWEPGQSGWTEV